MTEIDSIYLQNQTAALGWNFRLLITNLQEFYLKIKIRVGRNDISRTSFTVSIITGNVQNGLFTQRHLHDAFIPSFDNVASANGELERLFAVIRRIKLLSIRSECSFVVHAKFIALFGKGLAVALF